MAGYVPPPPPPPPTEVIGLTPGAPRPRIRATTPNPSRTRRVPGDALILSDGSDPAVPLYALANPPWWRRRARRVWREQIPRGFE